MQHVEGEDNRSEARAAWARAQGAGPGAALIARDAEAFLHQSLSSPCVSTIARAEGIWIEDLEGRRYMDFHGNSVHHLGYGIRRSLRPSRTSSMRCPLRRGGSPMSRRWRWPRSSGRWHRAI